MDGVGFPNAITVVICTKSPEIFTCETSNGWRTPIFSSAVKELVLILLICGIYTGAAADFQQATTIATAMVKRFGMSEKVKVIYVG